MHAGCADKLSRTSTLVHGMKWGTLAFPFRCRPDQMQGADPPAFDAVSVPALHHRLQDA
jgi:hypothetical protein